MAAFGAEKWTEAIASFKEGLDQRALLGGSSEQLDILEEVGVLASCPCACHSRWCWDDGRLWWSRYCVQASLTRLKQSCESASL